MAEYDDGSAKELFTTSFNFIREGITCNIEFIEEIEKEFLNTYDAGNNVKDVRLDIMTYDSELQRLIERIEAGRKMIQSIITIQHTP